MIQNMKLAQIINKILMPLGIRIIRKDSYDLLINDSNQSANRAIDILRKKILYQVIASKWSLVDRLDLLPLSEEMKVKICPLCNHSGSIENFPIFDSQCIFGGGRLIRFQCPECDIIFGPKKMFSMSPAELSQDYESHYEIFSEGDSTQQEIRAFHLLKPVKNGVYLNYGAGAWSRSVQILREQGWNVLAFEPHSSAASDHDYLITKKEELLKIDFDGIFSNNVLEHLRDPVQELILMRDALKMGGRMAHATPCFEYLYEYTRFHLYFYLGRSRNFLAEKIGCVISEFIVDNEFMCALYERRN